MDGPAKLRIVLKPIVVDSISLPVYESPSLRSIEQLVTEIIHPACWCNSTYFSLRITVFDGDGWNW
jgi:hypothetical protein